MKEKIAFLLKHNLIIQRIYRVVLSALFRFAGVFVKIDNKLVLFSSFSGKNFNDSPKAIYNYMCSHSEYQSYRMVWAFTDPELFPNLNTVKIDTMAYFFLAMRAKYWITNVSVDCASRKKTRFT